MKKKFYQPPTMKVVRVQQTQIICASTENLTGDDFDWGGSNSSTESLTGDDFTW